MHPYRDNSKNISLIDSLSLTIINYEENIELKIYNLSILNLIINLLKPD